MAKKSLKVKQQREQKYATREYNRCKFLELKNQAGKIKLEIKLEGGK